MNGGRVFAPDGTPFGAIVVREVAANLCFGGHHHHNRLFIGVRSRGMLSP
jgi:sugar lactone lactonase YvrE